ncbi:MAG: sugar ABC transporter permease [Acidimicrobiales bacterium]|nr:sugar ABC transporter permease [Acidimicrobiales bacterium]MCB1015682.1 sugar ABC transporter permease [Acidimicrobiales bacterium]MCB9373495.1 sugar ABC transporter permease [Microthrixaceae bacterium]
MTAADHLTPIEPVPPPARSAGLTGAAVGLFLQAVILGVAGAVAAVQALGLTLDLLVGIVWALVRSVGIDAGTPDLFPDLAIDNLDTYLLLAVIGACLLLLSRHEVRLGQALLAGDPEAVPSAVGLQWWFLGIGALFAFWTLVITEDAVLFPVVAVVLPLVVLALVAIGGGRPFPRGAGGDSSFGGSERWNFRSRTERREALLALVFLAPAFAVFYGFFFYPLGRLMHFAVYQQNRTGTAERYVGFGQLTDVLSGDEFREGLQHTLTYVLFTVPAGLVLGIVLAVVANRRLRGIKFFQTVLSSTVATSVAVASVIFFVLLNPQVGYFKVNWLAEPDQVLFGVSLSSIWQNLGLTFIIVLAGLQAVPDELVESATLDGAGPIRRFFSVTLPIISPTLLFLIVVLTVFAFQAFAQIDILTAGGPAGASETLVFKIFQRQQPIDLGEGSAMALGLFGITFLVTMGQFLILDRRVHYGS